MLGQTAQWGHEKYDPTGFHNIEDDSPLDDWHDRQEFGPELQPHDIWDAFDLDDEIDEPQPEYGDFWGELDDGEEI